MKDKVLVTGCARSGTTLLLYVMKYFQGTQVITRDEIMPTKINDKGSKHYVKRDPNKVLIIKKPLVRKSSKNYESLKDILCLGFKVVYIMRDGRDVIVSHHSNKNKEYHVKPMRWIESANEYLKHAKNSNILLVRYEDFVSNPEAEMKRMSEFLKLEYSDEYKNFYKDQEIVNGISQVGHLATGLGDKGARAIKKDSTGNWKIGRHKNRMLKLVNNNWAGCFEKFCDLLIKFGYEKDNSWANIFKE